MESSTNTCAPVHPLTDPVAVEQVVAAVAERSFFALAERLGPGEPATLEAPALAAAIRFSGPVTGVMTLSLSTALVGELAQMFSGDPDIVLGDAELRDMAGEFANMVTGHWLTAVETHAVFDLAAPAVHPVDPATVAGPLTMLVNGQPVVIDWRLD